MSRARTGSPAVRGGKVVAVRGRRPTVAAATSRLDTPYPPAAAKRRSAPAARPQPGHQVTIGDDAPIGAGSVVREGVTAGCGVGGVVTRPIQAGMVAARFPARVVGRITHPLAETGG